MRASPIRLPAAALLLLLAAPLAAQAPVSRFTPAIAERPAVHDALGWLERNHPAQVEEWIRITEIPGKSEHEQARAAYVRAEMEEAGLAVSIDSVGNVIGVRKGTGGGPTVVFASHMDTVHPLDTDVTVRRDGGILRAPGIFDNSASVANMLAAIRALNEAEVRTRGDLVFIGTVQEELGLLGMAHWLDRGGAELRGPGKPELLLVAMDGGVGSVNYGALGIYWTRYHFLGEGSHTNMSAGKPHPARALARAIESIYEIRIPEEAPGGAVYNVGMLDGGKIFNAIPQDVSLTMDLRSVNPALLDSLNLEIERRVAAAAAEEGVRWSKEEVSRDRAGGTEAQLADRARHPLVRTAVEIHDFLGIPSPARATGSTDGNAGVVRGIPTIAVGRGRGGDQHTLQEWAEAESSLPATKMVLLLAVSMAGQP